MRPGPQLVGSAVPVRRRVLGLVGWLALSLVVSAVGGLASLGAQDFYAQLARPDWAPPASVFGPVWILLYLMMAVAAWLVWRVGGLAAQRIALGLYLLQLLPNVLWSWLFFAWQRGGWAFADIVLLWGLIVATVLAFWRVRPLAGALLLPYLLWVSFATALNYAVWVGNPALLG